MERSERSNVPACDNAPRNVPERCNVPPDVSLLTNRAARGRQLSLGRSSILNLADRGELTRLHFGRAVRYSVAEIQDLVRRKRYEAQAPGGHRQAS